MRFTSAEYSEMIEAGILTENDRVELLDGEIVFTSPIHLPHKSTTDKLTMFFAPKVAGRFICRVQGSIELTDSSQPEPDFLVLKHTDDFYLERDAKIDEIALLVEVADSSLQMDLNRKREIYAKAGVAEYWVVDLKNKRLVIHLGPQADGSYAQVTHHQPDTTCTPQQLPDCNLELALLFGG
jgi:Uma2 family endonuclease